MAEVKVQGKTFNFKFLSLEVFAAGRSIIRQLDSHLVPLMTDDTLTDEKLGEHKNEVKALFDKFCLLVFDDYTVTEFSISDMREIMSAFIQAAVGTPRKPGAA